MNIVIGKMTTVYLCLLALVLFFTIREFVREDDTDNKSVITVKTPEVTGTFKDIRIDEIKIPPAPKVIVYNNKEVIVDSSVNDSLVKEYLKAKDSIAVLKLYMNSIKVRNYHKILNDSNIVVTVNSTTTGTLDKLDIDYKIKSKTLSVPVNTKKTVFAIYAGVGVKNTITLDQFATTANLGIQNKKGNIVSLQYGSDKSLQLNYSFKILDIKK